MNPYAGSCVDSKGNTISKGDKIFYPPKNIYGKVLEILQDGDGLIELDDGRLMIVKWKWLIKE